MRKAHKSKKAEDFNRASNLVKSVARDRTLMLYKSLVLPHLEYWDLVWDNCASKFKDTLQKLQKRAYRLILK